MKLTFGEKKIKFSSVERLILFGFPLVLCALVVILINSRPMYLIESKVVTTQASIGKLDRGLLRGMTPTLRRVLRANYKSVLADQNTSASTKLEILKSRQFMASFIDFYQLKPKIFYKR